MPLNETHGCVLRSVVRGEHRSLGVFVDQLFTTTEHHNIVFFIVSGPFAPVQQAPKSLRCLLALPGSVRLVLHDFIRPVEAVAPGPPGNPLSPLKALLPPAAKCRLGFVCLIWDAEKLPIDFE